MGKLPRVYANKIDKELSNNEITFSSMNREVIEKEYEDIEKKINNIFSSKNHVYKSNVSIKTVDGLINKEVVGKTNNYLITMDGELIDINKIIDIKKIY